MQIILARSLTGTLPADQLMFARSIFMMVVIIHVSWTSSISYTNVDSMLYIVYGVLNVAGIYTSYIALIFTTTGNVNAVTMNLVIPTAILSYFILEESITSRLSIPIFVINFVGIVLIANPSFTTEGDMNEIYSDLIGVSLSFASLISIALSRIVGRKCSLRGSLDSSLMTIMSGVVGMSFCIFMLISGSSWKMVSTLSDSFKLFLFSTSALLSNQFTVLGVKYEQANNIAILCTLSVPLAYLASLILFNEVPTLLNVIGAMMVLGSTLVSYFIF
ncbi:hypothetical protein HOLleu_20934 [Holothuria leucospilota]|uniref:EamA domain-containing protein n=1 Tax=Holothuria leucospilota TaxID=206669 RepID=A0A9Q1BWS4_HOLLE|nr:hypothetical protein HOLleu_20934 [Holothuria leucospilota]